MAAGQAEKNPAAMGLKLISLFQRVQRNKFDYFDNLKNRVKRY
jgi:hypothetical protein